jgi:hypothetical protein
MYIDPIPRRTQATTSNCCCVRAGVTSSPGLLAYLTPVEPATDASSGPAAASPAASNRDNYRLLMLLIVGGFTDPLPAK